MDPSTAQGDEGENNNRAALQSLPNFVGKHRMTAAIALLNQQIQFLQEEIDQLETLGGSSVVCKELVASVESVSDALLPVTNSMSYAEPKGQQKLLGRDGSKDPLKTARSGYEYHLSPESD
uniref:G protein gamma domain-containing protein n=1 Tax=Daucus carota subsp. sativus TaxID=79200 RepID=A0A166FPH6_DAUCS